jgi:aspartyl/glutamyl-tRNA(Asn/Gln) amidotransferase C subunit
MTKNITKEEVKKVAELAQLDVSGDEEKFADLLSDTLEYIKVLSELDTENVEETYQVTGLKNVFKVGKENYATVTKEEALSNAHEVVDGLVVTKAVFNR